MASPIEHAFVEALLAAVPSYVTAWFNGESHGTGDAWLSVYVAQDVKVSTYRLDFLLDTGTDEVQRIAIECDGHDFHDRTKQQAAYDRSRDRELLKQGIITIRFTGSEIHHSAERCAADAWECFDALLNYTRSLIKACNRAVRDSVARERSI